MVSDVLCDALMEIERYQKEMPDIYDGYSLLTKVKAVMRAVMVDLSIVPGDSLDNVSTPSALLNAMRAAMKHTLDLIPLAHAEEQERLWEERYRETSLDA
jgi:hypothetical protein